MYDIATGLIIIGIGFVVYFWKRDNRKRNLSIILTVISFVLFGMFSPDESDIENKGNEKISLNEKKEMEKAEEDINDEQNEEHEEEVKIELDNLQNLYMQVDNQDKEELIILAEESGLFYSEKEYANGPTVKIAHTQGASKLSYADSGDYLKVSFNHDVEIENMSYYNTDKSLELINYRAGTFWSILDQPEYEGYYINSPVKDIGDFTVTYDNGNEKNTGYLKVDSKEEQFEYFFKYERD